MLFLSPSRQCQSTEGKSEHSIHCRTSEEWGVAPFASAVRHQYPISVVTSCIESLSYICKRLLVVLRWLGCCVWRWMYFIASPFTVATWLPKLADALLLYCMDSSGLLVYSHTIAAVYHSVVLYVRYCSDVIFWHNSCSNVVHSECIEFQTSTKENAWASYSNIWETIMLLICPEMASVDIVGCSWVTGMCA